MVRASNHCSICDSKGHNRQFHDEDLTRSEQAGRLVYEEGLSFAEAARRIGVTRQAAHQGWRRYTQRKNLHLITGSAKTA
jgi:transposase-like protein